MGGPQTFSNFSPQPVVGFEIYMISCYFIYTFF